MYKFKISGTLYHKSSDEDLFNTNWLFLQSSIHGKLFLYLSEDANHEDYERLQYFVNTNNNTNMEIFFTHKSKSPLFPKNGNYHVRSHPSAGFKITAVKKDEKIIYVQI